MADGAADHFETLLETARAGACLSQEQAREAFSIIMEGRADDARIASLLTILAGRGETVDEVVGAARVMRVHVTAVPVAEDLREALIDTCGTGGAPKTFNVSTAAALIAAGAGARVAKHGNRSRTGRGSAEVLDRLGVNVNASPQAQARCLEEAGVCFSFAIHHHPAIRHAMPARRSLGFPTIFNLLGPLTNPAGARRQLLGVYAPHLTELLARALLELGSERAMVVHGAGGLDELSISGANRISECRGGAVNCRMEDPSRCGVRRDSIDAAAAADLDDAAMIITRLLDGEKGPAREVAVLNAAAALVVADLAADMAEGVARARESIDSGAACRSLNALIETSNRA